MKRLADEQALAQAQMDEVIREIAISSQPSAASPPGPSGESHGGGLIADSR
jgi:hypothetical protein